MKRVSFFCFVVVITMFISAQTASAAVGVGYGAAAKRARSTQTKGVPIITIMPVANETPAAVTSVTPVITVQATNDLPTITIDQSLIFTRSLSIGSTGDEVRNLQIKLLNDGFYND